MSLGEIHAFIRSKGYDFQVDQLDSKWHKTVDQAGHKVWYIGTDHGDGFIVLTFGDFREPDRRFTFSSKSELSAVEKSRLEKFNKKVADDKLIKQELTKELVNQMFERWAVADIGRENADYLEKRKMPRPPGVLVVPSTEDNQKLLVIPMRDSKGELWNIQTIYSGGAKTFHPGAKVKGCFYSFGRELTKPILIGEGFATCYAAHLATKLTTVCAFNIGNLEEAIRDLIGKGVPSSDIRLLADWDGATFTKTGKNPGMLAVQKLSKKYLCSFVLPVPYITRWDVTENVDFGDLWSKGGEIVLEVGYYKDIAADVYDVQKSKKAEEPTTPDPSEQIETISKMQEEIGRPRIVVEEPKSENCEEPAPEIFKIERLEDPWTQPKHEIATRNSGFHLVEITRGKGVKYTPCPTDLRSAFEEKHLFVTHRESEVIYAFTGQKYEIVAELDMGGFAEQMYEPKPTNHIVKEFIGSVTRYNIRSDEFFDTTKKVNFQNGWLDLNTLEFRPHHPRIGFKSVLEYDFDENAKCPEFDAFLLRVLSDDKVLANMVMEYLGYVLSGDECWLAKALVLKGEGSNGKSTFLKVVRALLGKANILAAKIGEFKSEYTRQQLDGKLACISEETPKEALLESSYFKDIVAGGTMLVRAIYGVPYNLEVKAKLIFSCNDMPPTGDTSHAMLRRLLIIPFNAMFTENTADPFMDRKLKTELPGIFMKALRAYFALQKRGRLEQSEVVNSAVREYQKSTSPVHSWLEERVNILPVNSEVISSNSALFTDFKMYCEASGFKLLNVENFAKVLSRAIPDAAQRRDIFGKKGDRFRGLVGLARRDGTAFLENGRSALDF